MLALDAKAVWKEDEMDELRFRTLGEILGSDKGDSPSAQVFRIYLSMWECSGDELRQLPLHDRYLWLIFHFDEQVQNGGIDQFLFNSTGENATETVAALEAIGAAKAHRRLRLACELFPSGQPSQDQETREAQLSEISSRYGGQLIDRIIGDANCCECDDELYELLLEFRRKRLPAS